MYIWDREPSAKPQGKENSPIPSALSSPMAFGSANVSRAASLRVAEIKGNMPSVSRASPAYYPPRTNKSASHMPGAGAAGVNVKPMSVLEGHGDGAVFDVRWRGGEIVSAGEDAIVGIWNATEEDGED